MIKYAVKFFRNNELITTGHGYANSPWEAFDKGAIKIGFMYENFTYDRCVVVNETVPDDEIVVYDKKKENKLF